jgi:hypothetical protein
MHVLQVGKPYIADRGQWPEAVEYNYRGGEHDLRMFFRAPGQQEVEAVRKGRCDFAVAVEGPVIFLLYCFRPAADWSDAPYSWHLLPETEQALPDVEGPETRALLQVVLTDAQTGLVRVLRAVTFSPSFTRALHRAIRQQAASPWPGRAAYDAALRDLYRRYATSEDLLRRAVAWTVGGT